MAKGTRVNALAKELGVESKLILEKLRSEGLTVPNHQSTVSLGLAETIREWFSGHNSAGSAGAAVETAPSLVEDESAGGTATATKAKAARALRGKKKSSGDESDDHESDEGGGTATATESAEPPSARVTHSAPSSAPLEPDDEASIAAPPATHAEAPATADSPDASTAVETTTGTAAGTATTTASTAPSLTTPPTTHALSVPTTITTQPESPAAAGASTPPPSGGDALRPAARIAPTTGTSGSAAPGSGGPMRTPPAAGSTGSTTGAPGDRGAVTRPTVTLASKGVTGQPPVERKPVTVAPQLRELQPATLTGPRIVRIEKADPVPAPRPRRPIGDGPGSSTGTGFMTARPTTGRGVKPGTDEEEEEKKKAAAKRSGSLSGRRRGGNDGRRGEAMEKLKEFSEQDLKDRFERLASAGASRAAIDTHLKKQQARGTHAIAKTGVQKGLPVEIEEPITVKSLSAAMGIKSNDIIKKLMQKGIFAAVNQSLDVEVASTVALEWGVELIVAKDQSLEDILTLEFLDRAGVDDYKAQLQPRPPVVTILGHVDHGKTSLLDKIRSANVAAGEAGGITQHTAAWMVEIEGSDGAKKRVTFIDTPGHQAFTSMRARGANMTDVVVLVVSAAEGVQPQTIESINHAKAAGVPIVVALNKIDRPDANAESVLSQLAGNGLNPVEWGGDIEVVRTSATTGQGIKELIEILDYQSQLLELKANPDVSARGIVIESRIDPGLGSVATVLVQDGTLYVGDVILSGPGYGRIRSLLDDKFQPTDLAGPSTPIIVSGLNNLPAAGDKFFVLDDLERARQIATERAMMSRQEYLAAANKVTNAGNLLQTIAAGDVKTIHLIIKADVQGSVETLVKTVGQQNTEEVQVKVIHSGVGAITESDVELAMATRINPNNPSSPNKVAIIGFHVVPDDSARILAEQNHLDVKTYRVIYEIFDDLKKALSGMLSKEVREKRHGFVDIRKVFHSSKLGNVAGCFVTEGHIQRGSMLRLIRDGRVITEGLKIETLRRVKDDVREVKSGLECGIKIANYDDIKEGDRLEAYITEEFERTL